MEPRQDQDDDGDEGRDDQCGGPVHVRLEDVGEEWGDHAGEEDHKIHDEQHGIDGGAFQEVQWTSSTSTSGGW